MKREINALLTIAYRDWVKLLRDRMRLVASVIFPAIFVGVLGSSLQSNLSAAAGFNLLTFVFIGVLGQNLFQSTASGIISLVQDRQGDFSQEIFVSPISRYTIIIGKIVGESMVAMTQLVSVLLLGKIIGVPMDPAGILRILPVLPLICLLGGAFGVLVMSNLQDQRSAAQIFPFLLFPQFFLAGVFTPIKNLPLPLMIASRIAPMTYAVDLVRGIYYMGRPEFSKVVLFNPATNLLICAIMFVVFVTVGTFIFVRNERNR